MNIRLFVVFSVMKVTQITCKYCELFIGPIEKTAYHARKKHQIKVRQFYVDHVLNGVYPLCACGCAEKLNFYTLKSGFGLYKRGHISRVNNNWGHNKAANLKSQETRNKLLKTGEIQVWNKNNTAETDPRIAAYGIKCSETLQANSDELQRRSERMRGNRLNGIVQTLTGSAHSQWKGGSSSLQQIVRSKVFNTWNYPKMKEASFTCQHCGKHSGQKNVELNVHHNGERFAGILQKAIAIFGEHNEDFVIKSKIADWVTKYHVDNDVSGIVLCKHCHDDEHSAY